MKQIWALVGIQRSEQTRRALAQCADSLGLANQESQREKGTRLVRRDRRCNEREEKRKAGAGRAIGCLNRVDPFGFTRRAACVGASTVWSRAVAGWEKENHRRREMMDSQSCQRVTERGSGYCLWCSGNKNGRGEVSDAGVGDADERVGACSAVRQAGSTSYVQIKLRECPTVSHNIFFSIHRRAR